MHCITNYLIKLLDHANKETTQNQSERLIHLFANPTTARPMIAAITTRIKSPPKIIDSARIIKTPNRINAVSSAPAEVNTDESSGMHEIDSWSDADPSCITPSCLGLHGECCSSWSACQKLEINGDVFWYVHVVFVFVLNRPTNKYYYRELNNYDRVK